MSTRTMPGVPAGGLKTVGQVHVTNSLLFGRTQNAMGVAVELLSTHTPGAPVVFTGKLSSGAEYRALIVPITETK